MELRNLKCYSGGRNTGRTGCPYMPEIVKGDILVPFNWSLPVAASDSDATIVAAILAALADAVNPSLIAPLYANRMQFIGKYESFEDKSEAVTMQKLGYGKQVPTNRGITVHEHTYDNGGQDYHNSVLTFRNKQDQYKVLRIEGVSKLRFANQYDSTGALIGIQGIELANLEVYDVKSPNFQTEAEFKVAYTFANNNELNEDSFVADTGVNLFTLVEALGVIDAKIQALAQTATRVTPLYFKTKSGNVNLADTLGAILTDTTTLVCTNKTSGVSIAVTSIALNPTTKQYVLTSTAGAGYVATQTMLIKFNTISILAGLGAKYYESGIVEVLMT